MLYLKHCGYARESALSIKHWWYIIAQPAALWTRIFAWWRHQMKTFSALLAFCAGNSPVTGEFPTQRPVSRSFDVVFDLNLNKRLSKQSWGWEFETLSHSLWRHCNGCLTPSILGLLVDPCRFAAAGRPWPITYPWWRHHMETFSVLLAIARGIHQPPVNSLHKGQWRWTLMFSIICAWRNGWVNYREAGDLRRIAPIMTSRTCNYWTRSGPVLHVTYGASSINGFNLDGVGVLY